MLTATSIIAVVVENNCHTIITFSLETHKFGRDYRKWVDNRKSERVDNCKPVSEREDNRKQGGQGKVLAGLMP